MKQTGQTGDRALRIALFSGAQNSSWVIAGVVFVFALVTSAAYWTVAAAPVHSQLSFGFEGNGDVSKGMIVSLSRDNTDAIEPAHVNNAEYVVGVSVHEAASPVVLDTYSSAFVATEGTVEVFVSTVGGDISQGDLISVSNIGGVGRKKDHSDQTQIIVGVAKGDFNEDTPGAQAIKLESLGEETTIGLIGMEVLLGEQIDNSSTDNTNVLVRVGQRLAGRPVSFTQVIVAMGVMIVGFVVSGAFLFGSIKGSFISIGRNPLASKQIYSGLMRISLISLGVMMLGLLAGYIVLVV